MPYNFQIKGTIPIQRNDCYKIMNLMQTCLDCTNIISTRNSLVIFCEKVAVLLLYAAQVFYLRVMWAIKWVMARGSLFWCRWMRAEPPDCQLTLRVLHQDQLLCALLVIYTTKCFQIEFPLYRNLVDESNGCIFRFYRGCALFFT